MDISDKIEFPLAEKQRERAEKTVGITDHHQRKRGQYYATNRAKNWWIPKALEPNLSMHVVTESAKRAFICFIDHFEGRRCQYYARNNNKEALNALESNFSDNEVRALERKGTEDFPQILQTIFCKNQVNINQKYWRHWTIFENEVGAMDRKCKKQLPDALQAILSEKRSILCMKH